MGFVRGFRCEILLCRGRWLWSLFVAFVAGSCGVGGAVRSFRCEVFLCRELRSWLLGLSNYRDYVD